MLLLKFLNLFYIKQPRVVVFVACKRQPVSLDGIGKKTGGLLVLNSFKRIQHSLHAMPAQIGHQGKKF